MSPLTRTALLGVLGLALSPAAAAAQFIPVVSPPTNPLNPIVPYRFQPYVGVPVRTMYGSFVAGKPIPFYSPLNNVTNMPFYNWYLRPSQIMSQWSAAAGVTTPWMGAAGPVTSGYMSGGTIRSDAMLTAQREFEKAQRDATAARLGGRPDAAKNLVYDQWAYERLGVLGGAAAIKGGEDQPAELVKALGAADEEAVTSGDALNHILVAVAAAEARGGKAQSAFLGPQVLESVRFSGPPAADAVNLVRQAGKLPFPAVFDDPKLKDVREQLEKDFAAAVAPLQSGKAADPQRIAKLAFTLQKAQEAAGPLIRNLPFEESTAARRFLSNFEKALAPLRATTAPALVSPAWVTDGTGVAELVKYMNKNKLLFGRAPADGTDSYLALHRALATYLFAVSQPPPKK